MYGLQRMMGSENFALWSFDRGGLMLEPIEIYAKRIQEQVKQVFESGLRPVFGWVGPELCIPPLMSPKAFDEYVFPFDKELCDLIHEGGGYAWVHCHGKMGPVLERFVEMGTDILNPIEPPPMGDVTLEEAFQVVGSRMGLEGNIQSHDLMTGTSESLEAKIHEAIDAGSRDGHRFILCPCSGYMEVPEPSKQLIDNLLFYVEEGVRYAEECG
jgi:uroporphyrinogen-III decarboxylase